MAEAGYNPAAMADFFQLLRGEQGRDPGKLERFFSDHPPPGDREARIREQARSLGPVRSREVGGFAQIAAGLRRLPAASSRQAQQRRGETPPSAGRTDTRPVDVRVERPSSRFERFEQRNGLLHHRAPGQLAGLRVRLWIRRFHRARRGCRGDVERPGGAALRRHREPLRTLRRRGSRAREPGGRHRRPGPADHPIELLSARPGRLSTARGARRRGRPCRWCSPAARRSRDRRSG